MRPAWQTPKRGCRAQHPVCFSPRRKQLEERTLALREAHTWDLLLLQLPWFLETTMPPPVPITRRAVWTCSKNALKGLQQVLQHTTRMHWFYSLKLQGRCGGIQTGVQFKASISGGCRRLWLPSQAHSALSGFHSILLCWRAIVALWVHLHLSWTFLYVPSLSPFKREPILNMHCPSCEATLT